jgi:pyruvate dehydrogenase E1 component beta subunit
VLAHCPGLKVVAPATTADAKGLLATAIRDPDPVIYLEPLKGYRLVRDEVPSGEHLVPFGQARVARAGEDVTVVAWSAMVGVATEAAAAAVEEGISVEVIDLRTLVPLDAEALAASVARTGRAVVLEEAPQTAGFGAEVVATIQEEAFLSLEAPIRRVSGYDTPIPMPQMEDDYIPDARRALAAIRETVGY